MPVTPESLVRHELVGLSVRVTAADNEDLVGLAGEVVAETTQTLALDLKSADGGGNADDGGSDRVTHVPKDGTAFTFELPGEARSASDASGEQCDPRAGEDVTVEGRRLTTRPARRTEDTGEHTWR